MYRYVRKGRIETAERSGWHAERRPVPLGEPCAAAAFQTDASEPGRIVRRHGAPGRSEEPRPQRPAQRLRARRHAAAPAYGHVPRPAAQATAFLFKGREVGRAADYPQGINQGGFRNDD